MNCSSVFLTSGQDHWYEGPANDLQLDRGRLYAAWRVKRPTALPPGGRHSYVLPQEGPWEIWMESRDSGEAVWRIRRSRGDEAVLEMESTGEPPKRVG